MGDYKTNLNALREAQRLKDADDGLLVDVNTCSPIEFSAPSGCSFGGLDYGPTVQCLRMISADPTNPNQVRFGGKHFYLALDPRFTAPNAQVGIMFGQNANINQHVILAPGEWIKLPQGFDTFWCYDASLPRRLSGIFSQPYTLGFCRFAASRSRDCILTYLKGEIHPQASVIMELPSLVAPYLGMQSGQASADFSPAGLEEIVVYVRGLDASEVVRKGWSCGIGLWALERAPILPYFMETPLSYPPTNQSWSLVDSKTATGLGQYSTWQNVSDAADGRDCLIFKNFPQAPALKISMMSPINSFDANAITHISVLLEGRRHSGGHKYERSKVFYDFTSLANTAIDTGILDTAEFEQVTARVDFSAALVGALTINVYEVDEAGNSLPISSGGLAIGALGEFVTIGPAGGMALTNYSSAPAYSPVPKRIRIVLPALGAGITGRIRISGRTRG